jgi:drug/metabolite transporter (DMT)-like permease
MISLLLTIIFTSFILVQFKLYPKFGINTFQSIVFNYVAAFTCGFLFFGNDWVPGSLSHGNWPMLAVICGILFISLFLMMGLSSQKNGVAMTSVAVKMSMALTMIFMIKFYNESLSLLKISGILFAFLGVFLMAYEKKVNSSEKSYTWMLGVLFVGSAILDVVLNYFQKTELENISNPLFCAIGFGIAGVIGLIVLAIKVMNGSEKIEVKNVLAGVFLGVPNFFSIYFLLDSYKSCPWNDSTVLSIMNVSTVLISALIGFVAFKENASRQKIVGLIASVLAIGILYFATLNG